MMKDCRIFNSKGVFHAGVGYFEGTVLFCLTSPRMSHSNALQAASACQPGPTRQPKDKSTPSTAHAPILTVTGTQTGAYCL